MNYLEKNLQYLKNRFPLLYTSLSQSKDNSDIFSIIPTKQGSPTALLDGIYIHSRFDPIKEAERFIYSEVTKDADYIIFAGFGLAYHIEAFLKIDSFRELLVVEPDTSFFLQALSSRDLKTIINSERVKFLIGSEPEDCGIILESYPEKVVQLLKLRSVYLKNEKYYIKLDKFIRNYISRKEINKSTLKRFGKLWVRNLISNAYQLAGAPGINRVRDYFPNSPALLIAAGPSLDNILPHLGELKKRFILIAVDTALRACLKEGVEPDFTVIVDPQFWNSQHLDRCKTENTIVLSETSTYPSVFRQITGKVILCSSSFPMGLFLEKETEIKGKLKAGGSVATAAWDFCRILGVNEIWCAGLDLGFPGKQTHCRGSHFEQRAHWLSSRVNPSETFSWHALNDAGLKPIESNNGNITWTDKRMSLYSSWFEEQMVNFPEIKSWNLSDEGIKIKGMPRKTIADALKLSNIREGTNKKLESIRNINADILLKDKLEKGLNKLVLELETLNNLSRSGMELTESLGESFNKSKDITADLDKLGIIDQKILTSVSKDIAGFILQDFVSKLLGDNMEKTGNKIISDSFRLYKELYDSTVYQISLIEISMNNSKKT